MRNSSRRNSEKARPLQIFGCQMNKRRAPIDEDSELCIKKIIKLHVKPSSPQAIFTPYQTVVEVRMTARHAEAHRISLLFCILLCRINYTSSRFYP